MNFETFLNMMILASSYPICDLVFYRFTDRTVADKPESLLDKSTQPCDLLVLTAFIFRKYVT